MNIMLIYDSNFGNTEKIARAMAMALSDFGHVRLLPVEKADAFTLVNAKDLHLLIVGCPTQIHGMTPAMRKFVDSIPPDALRGLPVVCFDTRYDSPRWITASAGHGLTKLLTDKGGEIQSEPESFFVADSEGPLKAHEMNRVVRWILNIETKLDVPAGVER